MMRCTKCGEEKDESNYQKYFHSTQNKWRVRKECTECFYKLRLKRKNPELYYQSQPDYKKCKVCLEWKHIDEYYFHSRVTGLKFNECMECQREKDRIDREYEKEMKGGSDKIKQRPNQYADKYQKEQTFLVMNVLGYTYNEDSGIWTKPGVKEIIDGKIVFPKIIKKNRKVGKYEVKVDSDMLLKIIEYREKGMGWVKIGDKLDISDTTAFNHYKKWKDTSKSEN